MEGGVSSWQIDDDYLEALAGDEQEMISELVVDFRENSLALIGKMRAASEGGEGEVLKGYLHQLKGTSGSLGMSSLSEWCRELEAANSENGEDLGEEQMVKTEAGVRDSCQLALRFLGG